MGPLRLGLHERFFFGAVLFSFIRALWGRTLSSYIVKESRV